MGKANSGEKAGRIHQGKCSSKQALHLSSSNQCLVKSKVLLPPDLYVIYVMEMNMKLQPNNLFILHYKLLDLIHKMLHYGYFNFMKLW